MTRYGVFPLKRHWMAVLGWQKDITWARDQIVRTGSELQEALSIKHIMAPEAIDVGRTTFVTTIHLAFRRTLRGCSWNYNT